MLWGLSGDEQLEGVVQALLRLDVPFCFLDQRDVCNTAIEKCEYRPCLVTTSSQSIALADITALYLRLYDSQRLPEITTDQQGLAAAHAAVVETALYGWLELTSALVINRPSAMVSNNSKPYQASIIRRHGFKTAATLITTDAAAVRKFLRAHGSLIYKSISGVRSIVSRLAEDDPRLPYVQWCPTQFQEFVHGTDYRVHVVGRELFACEVLCEADDYRYPGECKRQITACELPQSVAARVRSLTEEMGLNLAGVDLRQTPDHQWYCFEVNPSPAFTLFESEACEVASGIARLLAAAGCIS